ncbi:o-succinylbenzoate--CoA ligase [Halobacillus litoralis]|uniref:o-succinylbenzoate--CoA ligase n=1 Tax=Halobacillus litoralis TaxID=45668 RepID=UPI001CFD4543|nr:o-succinylbenzoate--CoA ligase [Halobacillus litoralis]
MSERIPHWLEKQAQLNPEQTALETPEGYKLTFNELRKKSRQMAQRLMDLGVKQGDHVAFLSGNHWTYPIFIHAISYVGAVVVLLNTRLTSSEISYQLQDAQVEHLFVGSRLEKLAEDSVAELNIPIQGIEQLNEITEEKYALKDSFMLNSVYTMMYTSGTTGNPKAVMHTYGNHWYSAVASSLNLGLHLSDKWLACLPLFHVGGFSILIKSVVYGMPVFLMDKFNVKDVQEAIFHKGVTHASVVTVMLQKLVEELKERSYPDSFRCMLLGGGPVPESLLHESAKKQIPVFQTYGMTETSSQIATLSPADAFKKLGSAGKALSLAELWIDADKGETGEIIVKGPMVSKGYYNRHNNEDRPLRTGDLGYEDEDGFLYVVDRVKDVIISGGENVYPAEIEGVLTGIPGIREAGVTGRKDAKWGEVPVAFLVAENQKLSDKEIINGMAGKLAKYKTPKEYYWVKELPRNASNKLLRRHLFSHLEEGDRS